MQLRAWNLTRGDHFYRHEAFSTGLRACGYEIQKTQPGNFRPGDVVLSWNRYSSNRYLCDAVEAAGGTALIAENGYIGKGGVSPHHMKDRDPYALGRGWHNDASVIPKATPERWEALGVDLKPWQDNLKGHVLVCPNRPFGVPERMMAPDWAETTATRLRKLTDREVRVRPHPGNNAPVKPLAEDLAGAWATVIWSSSAGVHSLIAGIPVFQCAPYWICTAAASLNLEMIEDPAMDEDRRISALHRMAHGQYSVAEIISGEAFRAVL